MEQIKYNKVTIRGIDFYAYDFPGNIQNRRKRIYGRTVNELLKKVQIAKENLIVKKSRPFWAFAEYWINYVSTQSVKIKKYQVTLLDTFVSKELRDRPLEDLTIEDVNSIFEGMVSSSYKNQIDLYELFCDIFNHANSVHSLDFPVDEILKPIEEAEEESVIALTESEVKRIEEECENIRYSDAVTDSIVFSIHTGLSASEILNTKWENVYFTSNSECKLTVVHDLKRHNLSDRELTLDKVATDIIFTRYKKLKNGFYPDKSDADIYVFVTSNGKFITRRQLNKTLASITTNLCMPVGVKFKSLRDYYGRKLAMDGQSASDIANIMGIKDTTIIENKYKEDLKEKEEPITANPEIIKINIETLFKKIMESKGDD